MHDIDFYKKLPSTNVFAKENLGNLPHLKVISTDIQPNGHGQFNRVWLSSDKNGGNCYISIVLKPKNIRNLDKLTQYTSLKVGETLIQYGLNPIYKYPNDVLIENKKIAGILAESVFIGDKLKGVVVGIGINLNLEKEDIQKIDIPVTSIFNETNKNINKIEFINCLLDNFTGTLDKFLTEKQEGEILCYRKM